MSSSSDSSVEFSNVDSESDSFDAIKALYTEDVPISSHVHVYDNLQKFENFLKIAKKGGLKAHLELINARKQQREVDAAAACSIPVPSSANSSLTTSSELGKATAVADASSADTSSANNDAAASGQNPDDILIPGRMFTVSQAPQTAKRRERKTVLSKMSSITGPLARIKYFVDNRTKVQVVTRNYSQVRGLCVGYIVAFDKHWNLCMTDVDETFQRRILGKLVHTGGRKSAVLTRGHRTAFLGQLTSSSATTCKQLSVANLAVDTVCERFEELQCGRRAPRFQMLKRHVNQLFIRGDNVVCVCCADTSQNPHKESQRKIATHSQELRGDRSIEPQDGRSKQPQGDRSKETQRDRFKEPRRDRFKEPQKHHSQEPERDRAKETQRDRLEEPQKSSQRITKRSFQRTLG